MRYRAEPSGITLSAADAALVKGMLLRGDRQHDIAAWFGVNGGRIAEIATDHRFANTSAAPSDELPPAGPYPKAREAVAAIEALAAAKSPGAVSSLLSRAVGWSIPLSLDPVAGVSLLSGVGAGPPPDGVG